jgi:hypothetical protein
MRASMPCRHWSRPSVWPAVSPACRRSITSPARRSALLILRMGYASGRDALKQLFTTSTGPAPTRQKAE